MGIQFYTSVRTGVEAIYNYPDPPYRTALVRCKHALGIAGEMRREGNRWRAGPSGRFLFQNVTVQRLIATGHAILDGDVVRLA